MSRFPTALSSSTEPGTLPSQNELLRLAREEPQALEALRVELVEQAITHAPERLQLGLRRLQFRIDGVRHRSATPLGAMFKMQTMMWDSFLELNAALQRLEALSQAAVRNGGEIKDRSCDAVIIDFRAYRPHRARP